MKASIFVKGFLVGTSMLVPGVSGGTMAMIFGIYDRLIRSVSILAKPGKPLKRHTGKIHAEGAFSAKKESALFLALFTLGAGCAFLLLSGPMARLVHVFPRETAFFVTGAIIGGIPVIYQASRCPVSCASQKRPGADVKNSSHSDLLWLAAGLFFALLSARLPKNLFEATGTATALLLQLLAGILCALALILPGVSFSAMLYMMGVYGTLLDAVSKRNFLILFPFLGGGFLGILFFTRGLAHAMERYPRPTYTMILGFVMASLWDIMREIPPADTWPCLLICLLLAAAGFGIIRSLSHREPS